MISHYHHLKFDATGIYVDGENPNRRRLAAEGFDIDTSEVAEWAMTWEDTGSFAGATVAIEYKLNPDDAWTTYQASALVGVRYTHLTLDNIFYNQANQTFLPTALLRVKLSDDSHTGTADCHIYLWRRN
mgnify:CR=1 FL=1